MPYTKHHISDRVTIEEFWTVERTPQLDRVKIFSVLGSEGTAHIEARDLDATSARLLQINYDRLAQMRLKRRLQREEKEGAKK